MKYEPSIMVSEASLNIFIAYVVALLIFSVLLTLQITHLNKKIHFLKLGKLFTAKINVFLVDGVISVSCEINIYPWSFINIFKYCMFVQCTSKIDFRESKII